MPADSWPPKAKEITVIFVNMVVAWLVKQRFFASGLAYVANCGVDRI